MRRILPVGLVALAAVMACGIQPEPLPTVFVIPSLTPSAAASPPATQPEPTQLEPTTFVPTPTSLPTATPVPLQPTNTSVPTPEPPPVGTSRTNPAPLGYGLDVGDVTLAVQQTMRPANETIAAAEDFFYISPEPSSEYIMVWVSFTCNATGDETCIVTPFDFGLAGSSGIVHEPELFITEVPDLFEGGEVYGGVTLEGWLPFQVAQGETDLVLVFETWQVFGPAKVFLAVQ
jgi:hypothetical protein